MAPDRELHDLVAELAASTPEDVASVLAILDAPAAARLRSLLAAYAGMDTSAFPARRDQVATAGLSGWLAARVLGEATNGDWRMTPAAQAAVRTLAASMPPDIREVRRPVAMPAAASRNSLGLFGRWSSRRRDL